jgi:hypothetical protein
MRIVNARGIPGTIGAFVRTADGTACFLTSHHVLFGAGAREGDAVWLERDGRFVEIGRALRGRIGRTTHDGEIVFIDCALGTLHDARLADRSGAAGGIADAVAGTRVRKTGSTTGTTDGIVDTVTYPDVPFIDGRRYEAPRQLLIRPLDAGTGCFSAAGDSGATVHDERGRIVGLLWGSNANGEGIASPIAPVLAQLGVEVM